MVYNLTVAGVNDELTKNEMLEIFACQFACSSDAFSAVDTLFAATHWGKEPCWPFSLGTWACAVSAPMFAAWKELLARLKERQG